MTQDEGRRIELEIELGVPADVVWRALTDAEELERWFPPDARVEPGEGGSIWMSWGQGIEGAARIQVWEPGARLRLVEKWGEGDAAVEFALDYFITALSGGRTMLRFVHSGFGSDAAWDDQYDGMEAGWTYFLRNLKHYLERHAGVPRVLVSDRRPSFSPRDAAWRVVLALVGGHAPSVDSPATVDLGSGLQPGVVEVLVEGRAIAVRLPDLDDSLLFVEMESGSEKWHCGVWLSTYGLPKSVVDSLRPGVSQLAERIAAAELVAR